ncbi:MAG: pyruvate kinase [Rickettsiales bacterium]|jgi:pyruvate kinase|nr:pyruvate kinase [Rickettsiales bacterium]
MQKFTKITSSIGPASADYETLKQMVQNGMNVCRLNFSHDTGEIQADKIRNIRKISAELGRPIAVLADLQGPKHRIGVFEEPEFHYQLEIGQTFSFDNDKTPGNTKRVNLPDEDVLNSLNVGDAILLNDGKMEMKVIAKRDGAIDAKLIRGTEIWSRRGFNLPDTEVATSVLTAKDREDLDFVLKHDPDFVAISFVQRPEDIIETRDFIRARTDKPVKIVAKIERPQAVDRIEAIIEETDAIMIARGDLAVEYPFEKVPAVQRKIIRLCRELNKPVIVATQMLSSMVKDDFPLRAEVSDIATAAYLLADCTMTSEETTISKAPELVVATMAKILANADEDRAENGYDLATDDSLDNNWSESVVALADLNECDAIVVFSEAGAGTRKIASRRPYQPIVAMCHDEMIANQLALSRGVFPVCDSLVYESRDVASALQRAGIQSQKHVIVDGDGIYLR